MGLFVHAALREWRRVLVLACSGLCLVSCATRAEKNIAAPSGLNTGQRDHEHVQTDKESLTTASLTLGKVISLAYAKNPTFAEYQANVAIAQAGILQAMAYPNPELEIGLGAAQALEEMQERKAEYQIGIVQPIELPGKRRTRRLAAAAGVAAAEKESDVFRASLRVDVAKAYYRVLYEKEAIKLNETQKQSLDEFQQIVEKRVAAGEAADPDLLKTRIERIKARRRVQYHRRQHAAAKIALNALCGGALPRNYELADSLHVSLPSIQFETVYQEALTKHPTLLRFEAELNERQAVIAREQRAWWPDLKPGISAGRELDKEGVEVTLGVELPLWNRNRGGLAAARAELSNKEAQLNTARQDIERGLRMALEEYENAREQQAEFEGGLSDSAAETVRIDTILYQQGETDIWQLLDSRRTEQEVKTEYLQALYDAASAHAEVERAIGLAGPGQ